MDISTEQRTGGSLGPQQVGWVVGPHALGATLMALCSCSCAAGAAAAGGQAGQCEPGGCPEHHREVHLPPQVQEGEHPKNHSRAASPSAGQGLWAWSGQKEEFWWVAILRAGKPVPSIRIFPEKGEECEVQNWCFNISWGSWAEAVV